MGKQKNLILPIQGMTCANCVSTVERNVKKLNGVQSVAVNLSSERAAVSYDESNTGLDEIINRIQRAGYDVALAEGEFILKNSPDALDSERIAKDLLKVSGVRDVNINISTSKVSIRYIPTLVSQLEIRAQLKRLGFESVILGDQAIDQEELVRRKEIK